MSTRTAPDGAQTAQEDPGGITWHKVFRGEPAALCGFVFTPTNQVSGPDATGAGAKTCTQCEVEYLELLFGLED